VERVRIGITDCFKEDKFQKYVEWIHGVDPSVEPVRLSWNLKNAERVDELDGVVFTGGGDVHPKYYAGNGSLEGLGGVDERRDEFEFAVTDRALESDRPILGVCRGMQMVNVYLGGTLVRDLVSAGYGDHTSAADRITQHALSVTPRMLLHALTGADAVQVNSYHHQAVEELGHGLVRAAVSPDGVAEAAEWALKDRMPFLLLVQWHPERSPETELSMKLMLMFLREVQMTHERDKSLLH